MLKSMIIAFSTYSRLPMPHIEWNENKMRYSICFFPMVGVVIGAVWLALFYILGTVIGMGTGVSAALLTVVPLIITGGIHFDGYLDTMDARSSYKSSEEKLKIMKDPHVGAFAIIYGIIYMILEYGFMQELYTGYLETAGLHFAALVALGYVYSRSLSGLSVVMLKKAKKDGMLSDTAKASDKRTIFVMSVWILFCIIGMLSIDIRTGICITLIGIIIFVYYRGMAYKVFGGITGDLAGYFLQLCELAILAGVTILSVVM